MQIIFFILKEGLLLVLGSIHYLIPDYFNLFLVRLYFTFNHTYLFLELRNSIGTLSFCCIPCLHGLIKCKKSVSKQLFLMYISFIIRKINFCIGLIFHLSAPFILVVSQTYVLIFL